MLSFKDSRQAQQKSLLAETVIISPENSFALCAALMLLGSVEQDGFFFLVPVCGGWFSLTFRFRIKSDCVGARSQLRSDIGDGETAVASLGSMVC